MRVLLTGATGLLGPYVLDRLLARGDTVRALALPETVHRLRYRDRLGVIVGNLHDSETLAEATQGVEVVYHLAQLPPASGRESQDLVQVNVRGTENLLRTCGPKVGRLVFISSVLVYRPCPWPFMWPIRENAPRRAHGNSEMRSYGQSKIDAEDLILRFHHTYGFEYVILRPTVTYGPGAWFVEQLIQQVMSRPRLALSRSRRLGVMQWVHASDLAEAVVQAGTRRSAANEVFNVAGDTAITVQDVAVVVREIIDLVSQWRTPRFQGDAQGNYGLKFDIGKAQSLLRYAPQVQLRKGLEEILAVMEHRRPSTPERSRRGWPRFGAAAGWTSSGAMW